MPAINGKHEPETHEATVARVAWGKPGRDWKVLKMDNGETWVGNVGSSIMEGQLIRARGHYEHNERWGRQFVVEEVLLVLENTADGVLSWLRHRLPNVGEERAQAMVDRWGEGLWAVLETNASVLTEIPGITADRADEIAKEYEKYRDERQWIVLLVDNGLKYTLAQRAYEELGPLQDIIEKNPYDLMAIYGINFRVIDPVARRLGVEEHDPRRLCALAQDQLENALKEGHCYMSLLKLVADNFLPWGFSMEGATEILRQSPRLVIRGREILLTDIDHAEETISRRVFELLERPQRRLNPELELPDWLDPEQREAALGLCRDAISVLTGGPGTGKTTTLKAALQAIQLQGERVLLAAPTGKAAKRMSEVTGLASSTIHSMLGWKPAQGEAENDWEHDDYNPLDADVVVIDETSMVDVRLCASLFTALGHARIIFSGDVDQLPSIGPGQVLYDLIHSGAIPVYELKTIHRQKGESWVVDNAHRIINGGAPSLAETQDFTFEHCEDEAIVRAVVELRQAYPDIQVLTPEHRNGAGTIRLNHAIQEAVNPKGEWDVHFESNDYNIYIGDRVLNTKNDFRDLGIVNGDIGTVRDIFESRICKKCWIRVPKGSCPCCGGYPEDNLVVVVEFDGMVSNRQDAQPPGTYWLTGNQILNLTLAYAMTVHKAQGSEWPFVVIVADPKHWSLRRQLLYTAVTRTTDRLAIIGTPDAIQKAVTKPRDTNRDTLLQERLTKEEGDNDV